MRNERNPDPDAQSAKAAANFVPSPLAGPGSF
jgi:hypothetical protein